MVDGINFQNYGKGWETTATGSYSGSGITLYVDGSSDSSKYSDTGKGINPVLYFKYVKSKFKFLERAKLDKRLKTLEQAFDQAVENGQNALAEKFLDHLSEYARESAMVAKGIKYFVTEDEVEKHKFNIKDGHISDTQYEDYTRVIPKSVVNRKKELEGIFDEFVIYHYFKEDQEDVKDMKPDEEEKMKDPILFGTIKENNKLYFIADWKDEYCKLTFDKLIDFMGKSKRDIKIADVPDLTSKVKRKKK